MGRYMEYIEVPGTYVLFYRYKMYRPVGETNHLSPSATITLARAQSLSLEQLCADTSMQRRSTYLPTYTHSGNYT